MAEKIEFNGEKIELSSFLVKSSFPQNAQKKPGKVVKKFQLFTGSLANGEIDEEYSQTSPLLLDWASSLPRNIFAISLIF